MRPRTQRRLKRAGAGLVIFALIVLLFPAMARIVGLGLWLFLLAIIIFFAMIIGEAGYKVFLKPYVRAWRINRIRNARYLREALERGKEHSS